MEEADRFVGRWRWAAGRLGRHAVMTTIAERPALASSGGCRLQVNMSKGGPGGILVPLGKIRLLPVEDKAGAETGRAPLTLLARVGMV